jgi:hypothetical protein
MYYTGTFKREMERVSVLIRYECIGIIETIGSVPCRDIPTQIPAAWAVGYDAIPSFKILSDSSLICHGHWIVWLLTELTRSHEKQGIALSEKFGNTVNSNTACFVCVRTSLVRGSATYAHGRILHVKGKLWELHWEAHSQLPIE